MDVSNREPVYSAYCCIVRTEFYHMKKNIVISATQLKNTKTSYQCLCKLCYDFSVLNDAKVNVNFVDVTFIAGNFFSIIGCIFSTFSVNNNLKIYIKNLRPEIAQVMVKNGFSRYFRNIKSKEQPDDSVIPYQIFNNHEIDLFKEHITIHLLQHHGMPQMSVPLKNRITDNLLEIFGNVRDHSVHSLVYSCGQYFHRNKMLRFSIVDIGTTIRKNVEDFFHEFGKTFSGNALQWAMVRGHSTRRTPEPGGLGFSLILEFIKLNQGMFSLISGSEGFEYKLGKETYFDLPFPFSGTIVTMSFYLGDHSSYRLKSEMRRKLVF